MRTFSSVFLFLLLVACSNDRLYHISGRVENPAFEGQTIYLSYFDKGQLLTLDSASVEKGVFQFRGERAQSMIALLRFDSTLNIPYMPLEFLLEAGRLTVTVDTLSTVEGTPLNNALSTLVTAVSGLERGMAGIERSYAQLGTQGILTPWAEDSLQNRYQTLYDEAYRQIDTYIDLHSNDVTGGYALATYRDYYYDMKILASKLNAGNETFRSYDFITPIVAELEKMRRVSVGNTYTDMTLFDVQGKQVALSSLIDTTRYTLIDFWASWCAPCRASIPALEQLAIAQKEHLTVVGVSLDTEAQAWKKAVAELSFSAAQLSDLRGWKSVAADTYQVRAIPYLVLIDKQGIIVGTGISLAEVAAILP